MNGETRGGVHRDALDVLAPHFHVCNRSGPDDGPLFWQSEAWEVRDAVLDHVGRLAAKFATES